VGNSLDAHVDSFGWLRDRTEPYNLGDKEFHLALDCDDYDAAFTRHKEMGCVCLEMEAMTSLWPVLPQM
jgi:lactoylglutathione lyase